MLTKVEMLPDGYDAAPLPPTQRVAPATAHALVRLRLRWTWLAALGLAIGALAYVVVQQNVSYRSTASVRLSDVGSDSSRVQQIAQTVTNTVQSSPVVSAAAERSGVEVADLESRLTVTWQSDTDIVEITVRGKDADVVPEETAAVVESLLTYYDTQRQQQIADLRRLGDQLLSDGKLADQQAENARRSGVGSAVASRQGEAASSGTTVAPLEPATTARRATLSGPVAAGLGGLLGIALGSTLALAIPFRRRRVKRSAHASALLGGVRVLDATDVEVAEAAGRFLESDRADLVVVATGTARREAEDWASSVHAVLQAHGTSVALIDDVGDEEVAEPAPPRFPARHSRGAPTTYDGEFTGFLSLGRAGRVERRRQRGVASLIVVTPDAPQALSLLAGQTEISSVVIARRGRTRIAVLQHICEALRYSDPTVVLVK